MFSGGQLAQALRSSAVLPPPWLVRWVHQAPPGTRAPAPIGRFLLSSVSNSDKIVLPAWESVKPDGGVQALTFLPPPEPCIEDIFTASNPSQPLMGVTLRWSDACLGCPHSSTMVSEASCAWRICVSCAPIAWVSPKWVQSPHWPLST